MELLPAEIWDFFVKIHPKTPEDVEEEQKTWAQMEWFAQMEHMRAELVRCSITNSSMTEIIVRIPLMTRIFQLVLRRPEHFPEQPPLLEGEFLSGFSELFEWSSDCSLLKLTEQYTDYCQRVDLAILEIKEAENDGFLLQELEIDEEEPDHLMLKMLAEKHGEILELSVQIDDFQSFPRVLRCPTNSRRTASFDCEKWNGEEKLGRNLRRIYGEEFETDFLELRELEVPEKDSFDDDDEIMDFI